MNGSIKTAFLTRGAGQQNMQSSACLIQEITGLLRNSSVKAKKQSNNLLQFDIVWNPRELI